MLVPFRDSVETKTRLDHGRRRELARAFRDDVLAACAGTLGVADCKEVPPIHDLNSDIAAAATHIHGRVAVVLADLPCLTPEVLSECLNRAQNHALSFVADSAGIGTTMVFAHQGQNLLTYFGSRSRAAHRMAGFVELSLEAVAQASRARRDVDSDIDLWDAQRIGVGPATQRALTHPES